jgi:hypothetical protein
MKKIILLMCCFLIVGCSSTYRMETVNEAFPDSEVSFTPTHSNDFLVRKPDGSIWYVRCDNPFRPTITSKAMIFSKTKVNL